MHMGYEDCDSAQFSRNFLKFHIWWLNSFIGCDINRYLRINLLSLSKQCLIMATTLCGPISFVYSRFIASLLNPSCSYHISDTYVLDLYRIYMSLTYILYVLNLLVNFVREAPIFPVSFYFYLFPWHLDYCSAINYVSTCYEKDATSKNFNKKKILFYSLGIFRQEFYYKKCHLFQ